jgi:hypothetical protein
MPQAAREYMDIHGRITDLARIGRTVGDSSGVNCAGQPLKQRLRVSQDGVIEALRKPAVDRSKQVRRRTATPPVERRHWGCPCHLNRTDYAGS